MPQNTAVPIERVHRGRIPRRDEPCSNPNCLDLSCKTKHSWSFPVPECPHLIRGDALRHRAVLGRAAASRHLRLYVPNQAATPKRRPIESHAQQYGRRPLSRAAAWSCVARTSRVASVEPLEEPARAVDGSRSPRRRERLRERVQEATGGAGRLGRR